MPAREPTLFYVTGFPKSGNKWLQLQLMSFPSIGGFHVDPQRGIPLLGSAIFEHAPLMQLLDDARISPESFVRAAYWPDARNAIDWPASALPTARDAMSHLAIQASRLVGSPIDASAFAHVLTSPSGPSPQINAKRCRAIGVPGMHTPVAEVRRLLPSFAIVNLVRDPRDVVVSYFYHYISTLTMPLARKFVTIDDATGDIALNPKWKRPFARRVMRSLREYYDQRLPEAHDEHRYRILRVRYEDLLTDGCTQLRRILSFVNCDESDAVIAEVVNQHRFANQTGSAGEQRDSLLRKGQSGDWRNYFDRELLRALGEDFPRLVTDLGYEPDDAWTRDIPRRATAAFDFSRFRIQRSTTRQFAHLWERSTDLRSRYPDPWQVSDDDSFYHWLCQCDDPHVQRWLDLARRLQKLWQVNVIDTGRVR